MTRSDRHRSDLRIQVQSQERQEYMIKSIPKGRKYTPIPQAESFTPELHPVPTARLYRNWIRGARSDKRVANGLDYAVVPKTVFFGIYSPALSSFYLPTFSLTPPPFLKLESDL
ncbi:hypothetical protein WG66_004060 [Moniliophthora roreri]|nr:hypothetical protein WG66_004060 [Moniliophthora roreri]